MSTKITSLQGNTGTADKQAKQIQDFYTASQWQLVWWRFRKHRMALVGTTILGMMIFLGVFAEFLAPYSTTNRDTGYVLGPPQFPVFLDERNQLHVPPFVYGVTTSRNPNTFKLEMQPDLSVKRSVQLFTRGEPYQLWGLISTDIHLFGVENGKLHLFGTDDLGRDLFSRLLFATRISLSIGVLGTLLSFILGILIGGVSGFFGGTIDFLIQRLIEVIMSIPTLPFWLAVVAILPAEWTAIEVYFAITLILGLLGWTGTARRVRSQLLALRGSDYIIAARLAGNTNRRLIVRHMLPSVASYIIVDLTLAFPGMILGETALSFLGLGLRPPVVSWGVLIQAAQNIRSIEQSPWLFIPVVFVVLAVLSFNFLGDGLRDAADPYAQV